MGPALICGIYHKPGKEELTENCRHEFQRSRTINWALRLTLKKNKKNPNNNSTKGLEIRLFEEEQYNTGSKKFRQNTRVQYWCRENWRL